MQVTIIIIISSEDIYCLQHKYFQEQSGEFLFKTVPLPTEETPKGFQDKCVDKRNAGRKTKRVGFDIIFWCSLDDRHDYVYDVMYSYVRRYAFNVKYAY